MFFASSLLIPESHDAADGVLDLRAHMIHVRRRFFASLLIFALLDLGDTALKGQERLEALGPYYPGYVAIFITLMLAGTFLRKEVVPGAIILFMLTLYLFTIVGRSIGLIT